MAGGVSTDISGRTLDIEVFQSTAETLSGQLTMTLGRGGVSRKVAGMQKLVQRYLITFMTPKGSVKSSPLFGTDFMSAANNGLMASRTSVVQYFAAANISVGDQLRAEDSGADVPDDEKYADSYLDDYTVDYGKTLLYLKIVIRNLAGDTYTFIIPAK